MPVPRRPYSLCSTQAALPRFVDATDEQIAEFRTKAKVSAAPLQLRELAVAAVIYSKIKDPSQESIPKRLKKLPKGWHETA